MPPALLGVEDAATGARGWGEGERESRKRERGREKVAGGEIRIGVTA